VQSGMIFPFLGCTKMPTKTAIPFCRHLRLQG
jgi:hypothetical protein